MPIMKSDTAGLSPATVVHVERELLKYAAKTTVFEKFAKSIKMPENKGTAIVFKRPRTFPAVTVPLVEGVTPNAVPFGYDTVTATLKQYGQLAAWTDVVEDTITDSVIKDTTMMLGDNLGRTEEALTYGVVRGGTNVSYANGTARNQVNTVVTISKQRKVTRALKAQKAVKITAILSGSPDHDTHPVEASYIAIAHTDLESDIRNMAGFVPVAEYGSMRPTCPEEIGVVEDVRYILSADLEPFKDAGGLDGDVVVSTTGTNADVYPIIYLGKDAFANVALRGQGSVEPALIPAAMKTKDDPLGQRGYAGFKFWHASLILNQGWLMRLEVAATAL